jgi:hypothetical protein
MRRLSAAPVAELLTVVWTLLLSTAISSDGGRLLRTPRTLSRKTTILKIMLIYPCYGGMSGISPVY